MMRRVGQMQIDENSFRYALGHFASGVTVVTARANGLAHGTTVSAFCSVSLEPPLVLVCIDLRSQLIELMEQAGWWAVNVLSEGQELVARHFASRIADRLEGIEFSEGANGQPLLAGVLASLECRHVQSWDGGDHRVLLGQVERASVQEHQPLLYYRGGYRSLGD